MKRPRRLIRWRTKKPDKPVLKEKRPGSVRYELILALLMGFGKDELVRRGYPLQTIYKYQKHLEQAKLLVENIWGTGKKKPIEGVKHGV
ncbi:hypothetical protein LCGC14_0535260 [marine sediment metagenome]|uniref:Uncharacterized protein n=1 Tax=marine sediment metagenome TaxID=412755 RepID=A0A0F9V2N2_9ZZZZ